MTTSEVLQNAGAKKPAASPALSGDDRITAILGSRRAGMAFGAIVFLMTLIQVLTNPFAFVMGGGAQWNLPLPLATVVVLVTLGCAVQSGSLVLSVRWPVAAVFGTLACYLLLVIVVGVPNWLSAMQLVVAIALFLLATRRPIRSAFGWLALAVALDLGTLVTWASSTGADPGTVAGFVASHGVSFLISATGATALGAWWGIRSRRVARLREEAEQATQEHEARVERARDAERARIAQELHDVAGQHLAGLITLADAAVSIGPERPGDVLQLIEDVRAEGRFAAASLYGALADLRAVGGVPTETTRDLRRAMDLLDYWRQRGMSVDFHLAGDLDDLPAVVSTTAFRGVQEVLTNASKHAPGAAVDVDIVFGGEWLHVLVQNGPARAARTSTERIGLGWGLDGLRDRVGLINGSVTAGPTDDGGWKVRMRIPVAESDAAESE